MRGVLGNVAETTIFPQILPHIRAPISRPLLFWKLSPQAEKAPHLLSDSFATRTTCLLHHTGLYLR